jgi:fatty acid desaturase
VEKYTIEEIARHNTPQDCWIIVKDKVYDVSPYVSRHPGGPLISVAAGADCTHLFKAYHLKQERADRMLKRYYKGELDVASIVSPLVRYRGEKASSSAKDEEFYTVLKQRVGRYFKENNLDPTFSWQMLAKTFAVLTTLGASYYAAFWSTDMPFAFSFGAALLYGFAAAEVGTCIQHDANHGSYTRNAPFKALMCLTLDLVGASSFIWRQQHVVGHHCFTNVDGRDPDIGVADPDLKKYAPTQPTRWYHKYQRFYLPVLYGLMTANILYFNDFHCLHTGRVAHVKNAKPTPSEKFNFWAFKTFYLTYMWLLPLALGPHSLGDMVALHLGLNVVNGYFLATLFQVAHITDGVEYPEEQADGSVDMGWAESQVRTAANFCTDSMFWMHLAGGLSHQIEHHLFPGVCHCHYLGIAPIVEQTCKEFGIPYVKHPSVKAAVEGHWRALDNFGTTESGAAHQFSGRPG